MKRYLSQPEREVLEKSSYESIKNGLIGDIKAFLIDGVFAPIATMLGVIVLLTLVCMAFGRDHEQYFGPTGRIMIGVLVPTFILGCILNKRFGNLVLKVWFAVIYSIIPITLLYVAWLLFQPAIEYFKPY